MWRDPLDPLEIESVIFGIESKLSQERSANEVAHVLKLMAEPNVSGRDGSRALRSGHPLLLQYRVSKKASIASEDFRSAQGLSRADCNRLRPGVKELIQMIRRPGPCVSSGRK